MSTVWCPQNWSFISAEIETPAPIAEEAQETRAESLFFKRRHDFKSDVGDDHDGDGNGDAEAAIGEVGSLFGRVPIQVPILST